MGPEAEKNLLSVWVSWWARRDFWCCDAEVQWVLCPQSQHHTWIFLVQTVSAEGRRKHWSLCVSIVWAGRVHTLSWQRWSHSWSTGAGCHGQRNQWKVATDTRSDLEESDRHGTPVWTREISRQSASPDSHSSVSPVTVQFSISWLRSCWKMMQNHTAFPSWDVYRYHSCAKLNTKWSVYYWMAWSRMSHNPPCVFPWYWCWRKMVTWQFALTSNTWTSQSNASATRCRL